MGRPKVIYKQRDRERRGRSLLDATGEIVREEGFEAITSTKVARKAGMDPGAVNKHFYNLNGLKEAYVLEKDYWQISLEKFKLLPTASEAEKLQMYQQLMLDSFDLFIDDLEMQGIILSQTSTHNPLLQRLSAEREIAAAELLVLSDSHFEGTGVYFRHVMLGMLSMTYFPVWHARWCKTTASGVDLNKAEDRQRMKQTIVLLIELAWEEAERRRAK